MRKRGALFLFCCGLFGGKPIRSELERKLIQNALERVILLVVLDVVKLDLDELVFLVLGGNGLTVKDVAACFLSQQRIVAQGIEIQSADLETPAFATVFGTIIAFLAVFG